MSSGHHLARLIRHLRARGRGFLLEDEGLTLAAELGLKTPSFVTLDGPEAAEGPDVAELPGERVVVKVLSHTLVHRARLGGVQVVDNTPGEIRRTIEEMEERLPREPAGASGRRRYLAATYVAGASGVGRELLLGYHTTREFGPVLTLAPGGGTAEGLAEALRDEQGPVILSPCLLDTPGLEELLAGRHFLAPALEPHGGAPPLLGMTRLMQLLREMAELARQGSLLGLAEFELNPIRLTPEGPVAVDALGRLTDAARPEGRQIRDPKAMLSLLHPRSIAVVGASATRRNPGRIIVDNVLAAGFDRERLTVVKAGVEAVAGCRCVPSLRALEPPVDLLVVAVDGGQVPDVMAEVVRGGRARAVILIPGGMETGPDDPTPLERTERLLVEARNRGEDPPAVVGPNCVGVRSVPGRYDTLFIPGDRLRFTSAAADPVALVSQSGAFALTRAAGIPHLNPRYLITLGNQLDVTLAECLHWVAADPDVRASAWYVEGFTPGDGRAWFEGARQMVAGGRPVLLYRAGRSEAGRAAASTHTASIAGDYRVVRELARQSGVWLAETIQDFQDGLRLLSAWQGHPPRGPRVGAVSNAGFECVALADTLGAGRLAELGAPTRRALREVLGAAHLGSLATVANPLDVTPMMGDEAFVDTVRLLLADPAVDVGVVGLVPLTPALNTPLNGGPPTGETPAWLDDGVVPGLLRLWRERTKPWLVVLDAGPGHHRIRSALEAGGIPVLERMDRVGPVLSGMLRFAPRGF